MLVGFGSASVSKQGANQKSVYFQRPTRVLRSVAHANFDRSNEQGGSDLAKQKKYLQLGRNVTGALDNLAAVLYVSTPGGTVHTAAAVGRLRHE